MKTSMRIVGLVVGCVLSFGCSSVQQNGASIAGVKVPSQILDQGETAVRSFVAKQNPQAVKFLDMFFPPKPLAPVQETVTVPVVTTYTFTVELTNGQTYAGTEVRAVYVKPHRAYTLPELEQPEPLAYSPGTLQGVLLGTAASGASVESNTLPADVKSILEDLGGH